MDTAQLEVDAVKNRAASMHALVYHGPGKLAWEAHLRPAIHDVSDAVVRITTATICRTDLYIMKGDVPTVTEGRILGHEGTGVVDAVGTAVSAFRQGEKVLISCITACAKCAFCRNEGCILGNTIDGTQAEYVRIPVADTSLYALPQDADDEASIMLSDILPTGFDCGVLNGQVKPGDTIAIVGAGPVGLAALLTAQLYSPTEVMVIDLDDHPLEVARSLGATKVVNSTDGKAAEHIMALTNDDGVDVAIEAVGIPPTFDICQSIIIPGGRIANVGVHGKPVELHLERLWSHNVTLTTRLVDTVTTPMMLRIVQSIRLDARKLVSHEFELSEIMQAYNTFENAAKERAFKVVLKNASVSEDALKEDP